LPDFCKAITAPTSSTISTLALMVSMIDDILFPQTVATC
jgi:hypothetical protein